MNADRAIHVVIAICQGFDRARIVSADANTEKMPDPSAPRRFKGGIQRAGVFSEVQAVKVAMGIYKHGNGYLHRVSWTVGLQSTGQIGFDHVAGGIVAVIELHADSGSPIALRAFGGNPGDFASDRNLL